MAIKDSDLLYVHDGTALKKITWEMLWKKQIPGTCKLVLERSVNGQWKQYSVTAQEFWDESPKLIESDDYYMVERNKVLKHAKLRMKRDRAPVIQDKASGSETAAYADSKVIISQYGELDPPGTNLRRQWQYLLKGSYTWRDASGATGTEYTPGWDEVGNDLRLKRTEKNEYGADVVLYSNVLTISLNELASEAIYFTHTTGSAAVSVVDSPAAGIYSWENGRWNLKDTVPMTRKFTLEPNIVYGMVASLSLKGIRFGDRAAGSSSNSTWNGELPYGRWTTGDIRLLEISCMARITTAADMFAGCDMFNQDLSWWPMENVENFEYFLAWCYSFNQSVSKWNWSGAHLMQHAFMWCKTFNQPVNNMKIGSRVKVHDASSFFHGCTAFNQDVHNMKIETAYSLSYFLYDCVNFNGRVGNWTFDASDLVDPEYRHLTSLTGFFSHAAKFNRPVSWGTARVIDFRSMFFGCNQFNQRVFFSSPLANSFRYMFSGCTNFNNSISLDTSQVTNFQYMFLHASKFNQPIGSWDVSKGRDFSSFFGTSAISFNQNLSGWDVSNATSYRDFAPRTYPAEFMPPFGQ